MLNRENDITFQKRDVYYDCVTKIAKELFGSIIIVYYAIAIFYCCDLWIVNNFTLIISKIRGIYAMKTLRLRKHLFARCFLLVSSLFHSCFHVVSSLFPCSCTSKRKRGSVETIVFYSYVSTPLVETILNSLHSWTEK